MAQGGRHVIEGTRHATKFVRAAHRNGLVELTRPDFFGAGLQVLQWNVNQALQQIAKTERQQHNKRK